MQRQRRGMASTCGPGAKLIKRGLPGRGSNLLKSRRLLYMSTTLGWATRWRSLNLTIIDEIHQYSGGTHTMEQPRAHLKPRWTGFFLNPQ